MQQRREGAILPDAGPGQSIGVRLASDAGLLQPMRLAPGQRDADALPALGVVGVDDRGGQNGLSRPGNADPHRGAPCRPQRQDHLALLQPMRAGEVEGRTRDRRLNLGRRQCARAIGRSSFQQPDRLLLVIGVQDRRHLGVAPALLARPD